MEWISVDVQLPSRQVEVLVLTVSLEVLIGELWLNGTWHEHWAYAKIEPEITHWMPLPEPPLKKDDGPNDVN